MRFQAVVATLALFVLAGLLALVGADLANWWTVPGDGVDLTCGASASTCSALETTGAVLVALAGGLVLLALGLNTLWWLRRRRDQRLRDTGVRVPAILLRERHPVKGRGYVDQQWQALFPDGKTTRWVVRCPVELGETLWLEAATDERRTVLMLDLPRKRVARDAEGLERSTEAAHVLLRAHGNLLPPSPDPAEVPAEPATA